MTPEQWIEFIRYLDKFVFLLQAIMIAVSFCASGVLACFLLHAKNQRKFF